MTFKKSAVSTARFEQMPMKRQRDWQIGAWPDGEMQVCLLRQRRGPRIDHDQLRPAPLGFADVRNEMDAGCGGIRAPDDDQARVRIVLVRDRRHLPVERLVGDAGRRGAHGARKARGAQTTK
jgi:hypothetical protein